jgi:two-component system, chemotaxis family, sensor kinase CheA
MEKKNHEFLKKLLATFRTEADEHVRAMSSGLLELEKACVAGERMRIIESVFREAHSLKGAARAVDMAGIETVCQSLESVFSELKSRGDLRLPPEFFDTLHKTVDTLGEVVQSIATERAAPEKSRMASTAQALEAGLIVLRAQARPQEIGNQREEAASQTKLEETPPGHSAGGSRALGGPGPSPAETVRIPTAKLNALMRQAEELLSVKLALVQRKGELREAGATLAGWEKQRSKIQPQVRNLLHSLEKTSKRGGEMNRPRGKERSDASLPAVLEFLEQCGAFSKSLQSELAFLAKKADQDSRLLAGMVDALLEEMKKALMLPFSSLLEALPKLVRDLCRDCGKDVNLVILGAEVEADRRILEEMRVPLVHLVRNCVDHGIESPPQREQNNKPAQGTIKIALAPQNGDKVELVISDDGAGITLANVRATASRLGVVSQEEAAKLDEAGALSLIFQSGISTSPMITDLSGRGLGLAIVREKVEKVGGVISVETQANVGTTFRILLPLTLASFQGVLVRLDERFFVLPTVHVIRALAVGRDEIKTVENRETIEFNGEVVPLVALGDALGIPKESAQNHAAGKVHLIVLGSSGKRVAFVVDEILNELEVLVKSLGKSLSRVRNTAGAAVLGTGQVVPVLNVPDLMKSAVQASAAPLREAVVGKPPGAKRKSVLVAEDSITSRTLLRNILESAGYVVRTAVDGADALATLRTEEFDLVVSDVDMPRMSGFDLTARIRAEKKLSSLPVVLVTALESREDRERGIDVGASAYIVKSSFDQSNLLEVLRRLI